MSGPFFAAFSGKGSFFFSMARDLRGPGLRAYFCPPAKVGKNGLRKLRFLRTFLNYGGYLFCARGTVWPGLNLLPSAPPVFCGYFNVVNDGPYRFSTAGSPGCKFADWFVRTGAPCRQYPFKRPAGGLLQVPERQKKDRQFGGFA